MEQQETIKLAFKASENSYSPYSNFKVGACLLLKNGEYILGTNIENAAYGSTMCAERNAVYGAYCQGYRKDDIESVTIVCDCSPIASPCGACRQVLSELLNPNTPIILSNGKQTYTYTIEELMPLAFIGESL